MKKYNNKRRDRWGIVPLSLLLALLLNIIPLPDWMKFARPDFVTLVLFYWCLNTPRWIGVGYGWIMGMLLDVAQFTLLGQHAIGKALIALIVVNGHKRLRRYHLWQQCAVILIVAALDIAIVVGVHYLVNDVEIRFEYWRAALTTALLWPLVFGVLRKLSQRRGISQQ